MKIEVDVVTISGGDIAAVLKLAGSISEIAPRDYDLQRYINDKIVNRIADEWIAEHAVEVMKAIDASAIVNMVSLRAAKIIRD